MTDRMLIVVCGLSFAGKTTLGKAIADRLEAIEVDVDATKDDLYGRDAQDEVLSRADWERIYAETDGRIERALHAGQTVVDASRNFSRQERERAHDLAVRCQAQVVTVLVDTPEAVARQRLLQNRRRPMRRDVPDGAFEAVLRAWNSPDADEQPLVFCYGDDTAGWLDTAFPESDGRNDDPQR